jgi:hypothetical protein
MLSIGGDGTLWKEEPRDDLWDLNQSNFPSVKSILVTFVVLWLRVRKVVHSEPTPTSTPSTGCMIIGQGTVFCWVPVPYLTMMVSSVGFFFTTYLLTTH